MPSDKRVDAYIERAPEFAKPVLNHLRELVHRGCPEAEEAIKWSTPAFLYRGKILFSMAAFKAHCRFILWRPEIATLMKEDGLNADRDAAFLPKITSLDGLPPDKNLLRYIRETRRLADEGPRSPMAKRPPTPKQELPIPAEFAAALGKNKKAEAHFQSFRPSHRREYIEWIADAKRAETREKRIATALEWIAEGKPRNWKYMNC
jgi:uncharacterized protein YdeI (YjbR/CyaY-like superfamily)